ETVALLQESFVPVAIDQAYQRRQKDTEGDFYRKIASQSPRSDFNKTTQGFYVADSSGKLLFYNNNRDPKKLTRLLKRSLVDFAELPATDSEPIKDGEQDPRWNPNKPAGTQVVRVRAKVLDGYPPPENRWQIIFQSAVSRDNLWITKEETKSLIDGNIAESLVQRIARFHLVDSTRGEPSMWKRTDIRSVEIEIDESGVVTGIFHLENEAGDRGYQGSLRGKLKVQDSRIKSLDMVALGDFWGEGPYTRGAPDGKFPLAVSFRLADGSDIADSIPPQGSRGWLDGYLR
ncbi:MAG: hypothetical protein AB8B50_13705, partial [Pirellulaceae bacterium]